MTEQLSSIPPEALGLTSKFSPSMNKDSLRLELGEPIVSDPERLIINPDALRGRTALITGGTSGLGAATADLFAGYGMNIVVVGRDLKRGTSVVDRIEEKGGKGLFVGGDMRYKPDASHVVSQAVSQFGRIDIGVLAAGIIDDGSPLDMTEDQWYDVTRTNLDATFFPMQALSRQMVNQEQTNNTNLVVVSSIAEVGNQSQPNYSAAKAGIEAMAKVFARDSQMKNVAVGIFRPGLIDTEMIQNMDPRKQRGMEMIARRYLPSGRIFSPDEAAKGVGFLSTFNESGHILTLT